MVPAGKGKEQERVTTGRHDISIITAISPFVAAQIKARRGKRSVNRDPDLTRSLGRLAARTTAAPKG